jgi:hypothetical protein
MAPPFGLTRSVFGWISSSHAPMTEAKASLTSKAPIWSTLRPVLPRILRVAGIGADHDRGHEPGDGRQAELLGLSVAHYEHRGGAVGDLGGIPSRNLAAFLERRLEGGESLQGGAASDAVVGVDGSVLGRHRNDLVLEGTAVDGGCGTLVGANRDGVQTLLRQTPFVGDHLSSDALRHQSVAIPRLDHGALGVAALNCGEHRDSTHRLDAAGDDDVVVASDDASVCEGGGLLGGAALTVDGGGRERLGPARAQHAEAADVHGLVADLADTAPQDVLDECGVEAAALSERLEDKR